MRTLVKKFLILAGVIFLLKSLIVSFQINGDLNAFFSAVLLLFILRTLISPVINLLIFPLNLITLNITNWILQILIIFIWVVTSSQVTISSWDMPALNLGLINLSAVHLAWFPVFIITSVLIVLSYRFFYWIFK